MNFTDILRFFVTDTSFKGWEETAFSWFANTLFVAIIFTVLMNILKFCIKSLAKHHNDQTWSRSKTWGFIFLGFLPIVLLLTFLWYSNDDFLKVAYVGGLVKGTLFSWLIYLFLSLIVNLVPKSWRGEL
ncbi:MAG TPA: hypothetical protein PKE69_00055 [Pyrinomonadaceae bacterium]|nr:hypothetical protein [Pyrinomonadaceae bacterium]